MRIVFVFPFCSPKINSISGGPIYLGSQGHEVLLITAQQANSLKGDVSAPEFERIGCTEFFRPYPRSQDIISQNAAIWPIVRNRVASFKPQVIVGFGDFNYRLPLKLRQYFGLPLVMFMEYLNLEKFSVPIRGRTLLLKVVPGPYKIFARMWQRWLARRFSAIMFSYFGDQDMIPNLEEYCPIVRYVPWCCDIEDFKTTAQRNPKIGIYIGSLEQFKNAAELVKAIPLILDRTDTERFIVVGPGAYAGQVEKLSAKYGSRLEYIKSVPRSEALQLIRSAGYGYTPVIDCGLGFVGDCWGTGTPLIATHKLKGFLNSGVDTLVVNRYQDLPQAINELFSSPDKQEFYSANGIKRYHNNLTAEAVGEQYLKIIREVVT